MNWKGEKLQSGSPPENAQGVVVLLCDGIHEAHYTLWQTLILWLAIADKTVSTQGTAANLLPINIIFSLLIQVLRNKEYN